MYKGVFFIGLGASIAALGGGITFAVLGGVNPNFIEKKAISTPEAKTAFEYGQLSNELKSISKNMERYYVTDGDEIFITFFPKKVAPEQLEDNIENLNAYDSNNHLSETFDIYKALKGLKLEYSGSAPLKEQEEYAKEYGEIKKRVDNLADVLYEDSKEISPGVEEALRNGERFENYALGFGISFAALGFMSSILFPSIAGVGVYWLDTAFGNEPRRKNRP